MNTRTARLKAEDSKNGEAWLLPLAGRLHEIIQERAEARRLDCRYVFHDNGEQIGDFRKVWQSACVAAGFGHFIEREPKEQAAAKEKGQKKKRQRTVRGFACSRSSQKRSAQHEQGGSGPADRDEGHRAQNAEHVPALSHRR